MRKIIFTLSALALVTLLLSLTFKKKETETFVLITTNYGKMKIRLYDETPQHKANFIKLVNEGYYNGTLFHRVISGFMIQGGDPDSKTAKPGQMLGNGGPGYTIPAEFNANLFHKKGALAAARLGDNINPNKESSGSQFYIVHGKTYSMEDLNSMEKRLNIQFTEEQKKIYSTTGGTPFLDRNYTVFGEVIEGFDVIDNIATVKTAPGDRPLEDVKMEIKVVDK